MNGGGIFCVGYTLEKTISSQIIQSNFHNTLGRLDKLKNISFAFHEPGIHLDYVMKRMQQFSNYFSPKPDQCSLYTIFETNTHTLTHRRMLIRVANKPPENMAMQCQAEAVCETI